MLCLAILIVPAIPLDRMIRENHRKWVDRATTFPGDRPQY